MSDLFKLTNKVAIVTGGASGIGLKIAEVFSEQGAIVHILDIDTEKGGIARDEITDSGGTAFFYHCDLTDHQKVGEVFEQVYNHSGSLDILVNNAAIACIGNVEQTSPQDMDQLYSINVRSVYSCLHFGVQMMIRSGGGAIVNIASVASVVGLKDRFAYTMSKGAVYSMTNSIARDYLDQKIRCNSIGPARIHTPFVDGFLKQNYPGREKEMFEQLSKTQPIGRMGQPIEVAHLATYLCSDEASFITGSFYPIDGGFINLNS